MKKLLNNYWFHAVTALNSGFAIHALYVLFFTASATPVTAFAAMAYSLVAIMGLTMLGVQSATKRG